MKSLLIVNYKLYHQVKSLLTKSRDHQKHDPERDLSEEDLTIDVEDPGDTQLIEIKGNRTDTDINIDIDRQDRESVDVEFEVDHDG